MDSSGRVSWFLTKVLHSACPIDVTRFPFDSQKCVLRFGSQTYNVYKLDIQLLRKDGIALTDHRDHSQWKLKSVTSEKRLKKYVCCPEPFVDILYTFELERKSRYYAITIIVPSIFLSLLASVSFLFPADSGERVSLVISVFLGLFVFMIIVNDHTPVTSDSVPQLTYFFIYIAGTTVLCHIGTAFILCLNHVTSGKDVPVKFKKIRDCIACPLLMSRKSKLGEESQNLRHNKGASDKVVSGCFETIGDCIVGLPAEDEKNQARKGVESKNVRRNEAATQSINLDDIRWTSTDERKLTERWILVELQKISRHVEMENDEREKKQEWDYTMKVFDRLFLIIFFIIYFLEFIIFVLV